MASAVSGFTASFTSLPFDMMKTRLQNMKPDPVTGEYDTLHRFAVGCGLISDIPRIGGAFTLTL